MQSVGRLYLNLSKVAHPKRWKSLQSPSDNNLKKSNTQIWYELYEKYESELEKLDEDNEEEKAPVKNKKKKKVKV